MNLLAARNGRTSTPFERRGGARLRAVLLAGAAAALVAALVSAWFASTRRACDWVLVDVSRSHLAGRSTVAEQAASLVVESLERAQQDGADLEVVLYGSGARRVVAERAALAEAVRRQVQAAARTGGEGRSDLHAALQLAAGRAGSAPRRVLVAGDGGGDGAAARAAASDLASAGARIAYAPLAARDGSMAELLSLRVAERVPAAARVQAVALVAGESVPGQEVQVVARDLGGRLLASTTVAADARPWRREVLLDLGVVPSSGVLECSVEAQIVAAGAVLARSAPLYARCVAGAAPRIDLCGAEEEVFRIQALFAAQGLLARRLSEQRGAAEQYGDVLVECDPDASTSRAAEALAQGAGVVQLLGARSAGVGELPCAALRIGTPGAPRRELHVLLDLSGSMAGAPARAAAAGLSDWLDSLGPGRALLVHPFAARLAPPSRWSAEDPPALDAPRGPTALAAALRETLAERCGADALLVVVSDGQDGDPAAASEQAPALRELARARRVRTVAVAVGSDPDRALLERLCGAPVLEVGDLAGAGAVERFFGALQDAAGGAARVQLARSAPLSALDGTEGRALASAWREAQSGWRAEALHDARALVAWEPAPGAELCFAAARDFGGARLLSVAAGPAASGGALDTPAGLAAAALLVRGFGERPRLWRDGERLLLEGAAGAPAHLAARVYADGLAAGTLDLHAPAQAGRLRQADWTELRALAGSARRVELGFEGAGGVERRVPLLEVLEPEIPPIAPFVPPPPEEVSLIGAGAPAVGLLVAALALLLAALLEPWVKGRAVAGR